MATFVGRVTNLQIIFNVWISAPTINEFKGFSALLDTGAQRTMVSRKVIEEASLEQIGTLGITPVSGNHMRVGKYVVFMNVPISREVQLSSGETDHENILSGRNIEVGELPYQPQNYDVLLGMDFFSDFHLTLHKDLFILSN